ncbi:MAG: threonine--tRNA ligase, partial [Candidatus Tectomicrobia bacterium]|nr:threonine--tRNA ligase [Candidatus Tectomicrobia bacterium]
LEPVMFLSEEGQEIYRHTTSHIMAQAVKSLFPGVKIAIGPSIEDGFYYDFDYDKTFTPEDLTVIEHKMVEIIAQQLPLVRAERDSKEAIKLFEEKGESYKVELIREINEDKVTLYQQGDFIDLCRGPHLPSTGYVKAFKLLNIAGAYWRGDERNVMLQRIYGTSFPSNQALEDYLNKLEEARRRDHRKLGRELDLFSFNQEVGAGLVIYHPKGTILRMILEDFERREHLKRGYLPVVGPQLLKKELWERSGHYENYRENMYFTEIEGEQYGIKPMNCLAHMLIYKSQTRSYRDLPLRYFELGTVYRHEKTGVLHGLFRVRGFTQDDAHILCTPEQLNGEILGVLNFVKEVMEIFRFEYELELSTRPEKSIGSNLDWERATSALETALKSTGLSYQIHEGEGAFYGPKIDIKLRDALGRKWQCATIQCDFTLPERFDLTYVASDGQKHRPVMIHRVILGALERFMGVLIEHYAGAFPLWLAPVQVIILPIADRHHPSTLNLKDRLFSEGLRVEVDLRNEKVNFKIREAQLQKIPYMIILGDKESKENSLSLRKREEGDLGLVKYEDFLVRIRREVNFKL